jgi:hypothetical protein
LAPALISISTTGTSSVLIANINAVWPSGLAPSGSAPASSSIFTIFASANSAACAIGVDPNSFLTFKLAFLAISAPSSS